MGRFASLDNVNCMARIRLSGVETHGHVIKLQGHPLMYRLNLICVHMELKPISTIVGLEGSQQELISRADVSPRFIRISVSILHRP
jgi:hypothetical protein